MDAPVIPSELVEAAAKALAGEPRCYCPDDWRADPSPRCPFHGDGEWPTYAHYLQARAVLAAVLPLIEQRVSRDAYPQAWRYGAANARIVAALRAKGTHAADVLADQIEMEAPLRTSSKTRTA